MNKNLDMRVNVLPALTYNFLHVNDSKIKEDSVGIDFLATPDAENVPEGVTVDRGVSYKEAGKLFEDAKERINVDLGIPGDPNGDTSGRDKAQAIRTGMGIDIENLMLESGALTDVFTVNEGVKTQKPIIIRYNLADGAGSLTSQIIHAKKDSEVTVIMDYTSERNASGFHGISTRLLAEEGAKINLVKTQTLGDGFIHFDDIGGACFNKGAINIVSLELGAKKSWNGCYINLCEEETQFVSNQGYLVRDSHTMDINYVADQRGKKTDVLMNVKGVLMDKAVKTYRGTLDFKSGSSGSVGDEQEDTLLLSPDVVNRSMPLILCQEEDVEGRHGATIGQLGEDLLFYINSRGIDEKEAKRLMVRAKLDSVARLIPDPEIAEKVQYYISTIV